MPTIVKCPNPACATACSVDDGLTNQAVRCPRCNRPFVPAEVVAATPDLTTVGRYQKRGILGSGAFGTVYRAYDPQLDREVALKLLKPEALSSPQAVERFQREARAAAKMLHPNIVPVHDTGRHGNSYYIASAFIDGRTLAALIPERGMEPRRAVTLVLQLLAALAYAHQHNVLHRDVKPANILIDGQDHLYLTDFGLAGSIETQQTRMTHPGAVLGTPAYMAPEQAAGDRAQVGPAADLYSAGVVLYELLTGRIPFEGPPPVVLYNVVHSQPKPPSALRVDLHPQLETICLRALAKNPAERFANVSTFAEALRTWLSDQRSANSSVPPPLSEVSRVLGAPVVTLSTSLPDTLAGPKTGRTTAPSIQPSRLPLAGGGLRIWSALIVLVLAATGLTIFLVRHFRDTSAIDTVSRVNGGSDVVRPANESNTNTESNSHEAAESRAKSEAMAKSESRAKSEAMAKSEATSSTGSVDQLFGIWDEVKDGKPTGLQLVLNSVLRQANLHGIVQPPVVMRYKYEFDGHKLTLTNGFGSGGVEKMTLKLTKDVKGKLLLEGIEGSSRVFRKH